MPSPVVSASRRIAAPCHHVPARLTVVAIFFVLAASLPVAAQITPYETAREKGALPEHGSFSLAPWETIDPWSGNVLLSFVDVALPGNAGFNLVVRRVYNSKDGGGWLFDIGMPHLQFTSSGYPIVINGDGSTMWFARPYVDVYISTSFWRYNSSTGLLQSPAGITYTFDSAGRPLTATDPFNNQQTVTWVNGRIDHIVQTLGNGQSRQIDFTYDAQGNVASLACLGRTWFYTWSSGQLTQAAPPAGPAWTFGYSRTTVGTEDQSTITVTAPTGGWVQYVSRKHLDPFPSGYDPRWDSFTVRSRQAGGTGVAAGTWQFTYPANGTPTTTIDGTSGVTYYAEYTFLNNGAYWTVPLVSATLGLGTAQQQLTYSWQDGVLLGTTYWDYVNGQLVPFGPTHALLPSSVAVMQSGRTYTQSYQYDSYDTAHFNHFGQPISLSSTGEFSSSTTIDYHSFSGTTYLGDRSESVDVDGITGSAQYDPNTGFLLSRTARLLTTSFTPDPYGNIATQTVGGSQTTTLTHTWGVMSSATVTNPPSALVRTVNPDGTVATASENGHLTTFSYDAAGRLTSVQPPIGNPFGITYASDGSWVTRARGTAWTTACLDGFGRTAFTFDSTGARTDVEYDAMGRVIRQTLPYTTTPAPSSCSSPPASTPPSTSFQYDALGRVTTRTNPDSTFVTYAFDGATAGLRTTTTDELNHTTIQVLEASGTPSHARVHSVTNADNQTTTYSYTAAGQLTQILAPNGLAKTWTYGPQGRLHLETQPESGTVQYSYDSLSRVATRTDAMSKTITYAYDALNRVIGMTTDPATPYSAGFEYDASGYRISASNGYAASHFEYDAGNRLTKRIDEITGRQFETSFAYDDNDNLTDLWYPSGHRVSYHYDANNRLVSVDDTERGLEFARDFVYRPSGALASYTSGNGIVNAIDYNTVEQLTHVGSSGGVVDLTYTYDDAGNVTGIADGRQGQNATYGYDALNRLVAGTGPWGSLTYAYDAIGNRVSSAVNGTTTIYSYGPTTNRLSSLIRDGQQFEGFDYDGLGRLTQDSAVQTYTYTPANLLETAQTWAGALNTYRYDADGRRVLKIAGTETSRTYVVNELSEFSTEGGPLTWTVDYVSAGSRLLAAVRPAAGTLYTLTVTKAGAGGGRVSAVPAGLDCGPDCAARYLDGTIVVLTVVADATSSFTGWSGACSGTATTVTVIVDASTSCTATFTPILSALTIQKAGDGSDDGWVGSTPSGIDCGTACSASFGTGTTVQLTATAADGFEFVRWDGTGCATGTVRMDGARSCTAIFQATPPAGCDPEAEELCRSQGGRWDESACLCEMVSRGSRGRPLSGLAARAARSGSGRFAVADDVAAGGGGEPASSAVVVASVRGPGVAGGDLRSFGLAIARRLIVLAEWARPVTGRGRVRAAAVCSGRTATARASAWVVTGPTAAPPTAVPAAAIRAGRAAVSFGPVPGPAGGPHESDDAAAAAPALPPPPTPLQVVEYYHLDAIGSVRAVTDAQGQVIARHDFLPFGEELAPQSPPRDRRLFTGQERDVETGLDYFHARQLRVDLGRFTVPDPLTDLAWTDARAGAVATYGYAWNNPLGFVDPMGMQSQSGGGDGTVVVSTCSDFGCDWKETVNVIALIYVSPLGSTLSTREAEMVERPTEIQTAEGGGGTQTNPANIGKNSADVARCAARFSNDHSMAAAIEAATGGKVSRDNLFVNGFLGSDAATVSNLITGPNRGQTLISPGISQGTVAMVKVVGNLPNPAATGLASMGTATVNETAGGTAFVTSWTDATVATSVLGRGVGKAFAVFSVGKAIWDVSTYAYGAVQCY